MDHTSAPPASERLDTSTGESSTTRQRQYLRGPRQTFRRPPRRVQRSSGRDTPTLSTIKRRALPPFDAHREADTHDTRSLENALASPRETGLFKNSTVTKTSGAAR